MFCSSQWTQVSILFLPRVLAPEKPPIGDLSQFGHQASPRVSRDLLTDSKFCVQSHFLTYQPGLNYPLLLKVILARDPDSDLISPGHSTQPEPAPVLIDGLPAGWMDGADAVIEIGQIEFIWLLSVDYCPFEYVSVNLKERFLSGQVIRMMSDSFPVGWTAWKRA